MECDEEATRQFYDRDKRRRRGEYEKMAYEERTLRALFKRIDEAAAEDAAIAEAIAQGVTDAEAFLELSAGRAVIADRCAARAADEAAERLRMIEAWKLKPTGGPCPTKLTKRDMDKFARECRESERAAFTREQKKMAMLEAQAKVDARYLREQEDITCDELYEAFMVEVFREMVAEEHARDIEAKRRAERETGLYFQDPGHMTFSVYFTLAQWWRAEKKALRSNLERWGAASVMDQLRTFSDAERAAQRRQGLAANAAKFEAKERIVVRTSNEQGDPFGL